MTATSAAGMWQPKQQQQQQRQQQQQQHHQQQQLQLQHQPLPQRAHVWRRKINMFGGGSCAQPQPVVVNGTAAADGFAPCDGHAAPGEPSAEQVAAFLRAHADFLERFVLEEVQLEQLERWVIRGTRRAKQRLDPASASAAAAAASASATGSSAAAAGKNGRKTSLSRWKFCVHADKRQMLQELTRSLQQRPAQAHVLWELAACICQAVAADGFRLFLADRQRPGALAQYLGLDLPSEGGDAKVQRLSAEGSGQGQGQGQGQAQGQGQGQAQGAEVAAGPAFVARTKEPLRLSRGDHDPRCPDAAFQPDSECAHVLYQPVVQPDGQLAAVLELWRRAPGPPFHEEDEEIATSYLVWGGIALHYAHLYVSMNKQRSLNDFLLAVVKSIFQDMVSIDALVMKIMNFAQRLVDADRASLFLVDSKNKELYARIFDVGVSDVDENGEMIYDANGKPPSSKEIRFPLGTGIAGQVALTGEILNIDDAYSDPRFNRMVDQLTGYHTQSILCMPIFIRGAVIGVVQMVNKHVGTFTKEDEEAFETFAVYCGLALHHAKLYDKIARSEQKYRVALEVLSYHNTCSEDEVEKMHAQGIPESIPGVDDYYFSVFALDDYEKARHAIYMFHDLFGSSRFDTDSVIRFTLTVKKNYRRVPYHNWTHGFAVANSMYSIIKHSHGVFSPNECLALFIAALCHDLDHRGKNNKFMLETESPLAAIYSTSTMEHHHFNQTVTILQQKGHNIFSKLSSSEYKQVLGLMKHCILATDLAVFFPNKAKINQLLSENSFNFNNNSHRLLLQAITMTASDLSASAKPWELQVETVKVIFEEFYEQGDAERANGLQPIPMMDRNQPDQQASSQVGFLTGICLPCYALMDQLIPSTHPMLEQCKANLKRWQEIDASSRLKEQKT